MLAAAADALRDAGALDVVLFPSLMKKGRPGTRIEVLAAADHADDLEAILLQRTSTIGVRRWDVSRRSLPREVYTVRVGQHAIRVKVVRTPDGGWRAKAEFDDVLEAARQMGRDPRAVADAAVAALGDVRDSAS
jgi:pyridinium-3,5-bisthiocarboxylic acid mononucleotide nickel chelatase